MQTTDFIWFDGKMVPWADAQVHVLTHALHYGSAVFEGIRAYACADGTSAVFRLKEHSQRLLNSAKILRLNIPYTVDEISQGILDTLKANKMKEGYIRPLSFVGDGEMGVYPGNNKVHTIIAVWPLGATVHLCGSVLTETFFVMTISLMLYGSLPSVGTMLLFCVLLGIFAVGAPGVPGGTVVASLGIVTGVLGFDPNGVALLIAIFALQDSFGTACNVTGDGALTLMLEGLFNRNGELGPLQDVAPAEKV